MTNAGAAPHERVEAEPHRGPRTRQHGSGSGGERVTVNLTVKATQALHEVAELNGDTKTDSINRALVVYAYLERILDAGGKVFVREAGSEDVESVRFL